MVYLGFCYKEARYSEVVLCLDLAGTYVTAEQECHSVITAMRARLRSARMIFAAWPALRGNISHFTPRSTVAKILQHAQAAFQSGWHLSGRGRLGDKIWPRMAAISNRRSYSTGCRVSISIRLRRSIWGSGPVSGRVALGGLELSLNCCATRQSDFWAKSDIHEY